MSKIGVAVIGLSLALCTSAHSQQPAATKSARAGSIPAEATDKLANDLAALQRRIQEAQEQATLDAANQTGKFVEVTRDDSKVLGGADSNARIEFTAKIGQKLPVLDRSNDFYAVGLPDGKAGWITSSDVKPTFLDPKTASKLTKDEWKNWKYDIPVIKGVDTVSQGNEAQNSVSQQVYKLMTEAAVNFRDSYKDNPYFKVTGFAVVVSIPPALNLEFSFK